MRHVRENDSSRAATVWRAAAGHAVELAVAPLEGATLCAKDMTGAIVASRNRGRARR